MNREQLSVIVATRDRAQYLDAMLASYANEWALTRELLVVDNGSKDDTAAVLERWTHKEPKLSALFVAEPGKSLALNRGIRATSSPYVAFLDDDILVEPGWAEAFVRAFETTDCAGFQGPILLEASARSDPEKAALARRYFNVLPITDYGTSACAVTELVGANIAVRRASLERVGGFDESLGPGRQGFGEDWKLGREIVSGGGKLGYVAEARVQHVYHARRMTAAHFEAHNRSLGRSRFAMKGNKLATSVIPNLVTSMIRSRLAKWSGSEQAYYRNLARYFAYSEMLRAHRDRARGAGAGARTS